jgi:hypothetical protein
MLQNLVLLFSNTKYKVKKICREHICRLTGRINVQHVKRALKKEIINLTVTQKIKKNLANVSLNNLFRTIQLF